MCGIVGMISRRPAGFSYGDMDLYENMLIINTLRGRDSTGAFTRFRNGDVRVIKHGSHPLNLFRTNEWKDFKQQIIQRGKFVVGHNRAATRGAVNTDNAHPFVEDNIILVHNGTLREQSNLTKEATVVDSHAIAHALKEGSYAEVVPKINGAFALVWYDTNTDRLYAVRNDERPLNLLISKDIMFLSSEAWIAGMPASRAGIGIEQNIVIEPGEVFVFEPDGKYTVEKVSLRGKHWAEDESSWAWKQHVKKTLGIEPDDVEEVTPPFEKGTETPEIKDLRKALASNVTSRSQTTNSMTHSRNCALTRLEESIIRTPSEEEVDEGRTVSVHRSNESFPRDKTVLIKATETSRMINNRFKFNGIIYTPELERVDVQGFLPHEVQQKDLMEWMETNLTAKVQFTTWTTNGGWTVHVKDVKKAIYTRVHEKEVPIMLWDFARNHCQCSKCGRGVDSWEKMFTSVKLGGEVTKAEKPINTVIVTCPDCIIQSIEKEDFRVGFESKYKLAKSAIEKARAASADRNRSLQPGEPVGSDLSPKHVKLLELPGPQTLQ